MSSDYDKWARFDDEKCIAEMDRREETESVQWISDHKHSNSSKSVGVMQRNFEAVESKRAVELLKASKRSRRNRVGNMSLETSSTVTNAPLVDPIQEALRILILVTRNVDKLASFTEKKRLHFRGLDVVLTLIKDMETLDSIISKSILGSVDPKRVADFEDSKMAMFTQTFACGSLFALSTGHFSVAADFTRALIHIPGHDKECGYWILRALAFAGMGSPFLCHLHLKTAASMCSSFPGLQECIAFFDNDPTRLVRSRRPGHIEKEILRSVFYIIPDHDVHLTESPDLSRLFLSDLEHLLDSDRLFSWCDRAYFQDSCLDALETIFLRNIVKEGNPVDTTSFISFSFFLSHRLFLEGQIFYLEGHFATAESKYLAAASIVADCLRRFETTAALSTLVGKLRFFFSSICINLGMCSCRLQKFGRLQVPNNNWRSHFPDRLLQWNGFEAMDWYRLSHDLCESPISIWKQLCVAIDQMWLDEAISLAEELESFVLSKIDEEDHDSPCLVANYGHRTLSQAYLLGTQCNIHIVCDQMGLNEGQNHASPSKDRSDRTVADGLGHSCRTQLMSLPAVSTNDWMSLIENRRLLIRHLQLKTGH